MNSYNVPGLTQPVEPVRFIGGLGDNWFIDGISIKLKTDGNLEFASEDASHTNYDYYDIYSPIFVYNDLNI